MHSLAAGAEHSNNTHTARSHKRENIERLWEPTYLIFVSCIFGTLRQRGLFLLHLSTVSRDVSIKHMLVCITVLISTTYTCQHEKIGLAVTGRTGLNDNGNGDDDDEYARHSSGGTSNGQKYILLRSCGRSCMSTIQLVACADVV